MRSDTWVWNIPASTTGLYPSRIRPDYIGHEVGAKKRNYPHKGPEFARFGQFNRRPARAGR